MQCLSIFGLQSQDQKLQDKNSKTHVFFTQPWLLIKFLID